MKNKKNKKKGFFASLLDGLDKKMKEQAGMSSVCCCGPSTQQKKTKGSKNSCCNG